MVPTYGDDSILALMLGDQPEATEAARAMAQRIRGNQAISMAGALASPQGIPAMGQVAGQQAAQLQGLMEKGAAARMHYGAEAENRKIQGKLQETLLRLQGKPTVTPHAANAALAPVPDGKGGFVFVPVGGPNVQPAGGAGLGYRQERDLQKDMKEFTDKTNPSRQSSRSKLGMAAVVDRRGQALQRLLYTKPDMTDEELNKFNPQWVSESYQSLLPMVNGGYAPVMAALAKIEPSTMQMSLANLKQWLTNQVQGANAAPFLRQVMSALEREERGVKLEYAKNFANITPGYKHLVRHGQYGKEVRRIAKNLGVDSYFDEDMNLTPEAGQALAQDRLPEEVTAMKTGIIYPRKVTNAEGKIGYVQDEAEYADAVSKGFK